MVIVVDEAQCLLFVLLWHDILLWEDVSVSLFGIQITVNYSKEAMLNSSWLEDQRR